MVPELNHFMNRQAGFPLYVSRKAFLTLIQAQTSTGGGSYYTKRGCNPSMIQT